MAASSADETLTNDTGDDILEKLTDKWDPCSCKDWDDEKPNKQCFLRIKRSFPAQLVFSPPNKLH